MLHASLYNSTDVQQWLARYDLPLVGMTSAMSMVVDAFGKLYAAGTGPNASSNTDYITIKTMIMPQSNTMRTAVRNGLSGVYLCRLQAGDFVETKKLILLR